MRSVRRIVAVALVAALATLTLSGCFGTKKAEPTFEVHSTIIGVQTLQNIYQLDYNKFATSIDKLKKFEADTKANDGYDIGTDWRDGEVYVAMTGNGKQYIVVAVSTTIASSISMQYVNGDDSVTDADFVEFNSVDEYNAAPSPVDGLEKPKL